MYSAGKMSHAAHFWKDTSAPARWDHSSKESIEVIYLVYKGDSRTAWPKKFHCYLLVELQDRDVLIEQQEFSTIAEKEKTKWWQSFSEMLSMMLCEHRYPQQEKQTLSEDALD